MVSGPAEVLKIERKHQEIKYEEEEGGYECSHAKYEILPKNLFTVNVIPLFTLY